LLLLEGTDIGRVRQDRFALEIVQLVCGYLLLKDTGFDSLISPSPNAASGIQGRIQDWVKREKI